VYGPQALEVADFSAEGKAECCLLVSCVCVLGWVFMAGESFLRV
jgi:hypothetical protein